MEKYSLESDEFKVLERRLEEFTTKFYHGKRRISPKLSKEDAVALFRKDLHKNMRRFLHEYEMSYINKRINKTAIRKLLLTEGKSPLEVQKALDEVDNDSSIYLKGELSSEWLQYILYVCRFLCARSDGLKPSYTIQGKNGEGIFMCAMNNWLRYWGIPTRLQFNKKSFVYGGDGGADFFLGSYKFDIKHRDDGPNTGLILKKGFLDNIEDEVVLVYCANATNIKLGQSLTKQTEDLSFNEISGVLREQVFPLSIVGWITAAEFKASCEHRNGSPTSGPHSRWVVDNLHNISELFMGVVEDQFSCQDLFC